MKLSLLLLPLTLLAQDRSLQPPEQPNPKTLLPQSLIEQIVNEVSGSLAMNSIYDLAGYEHDRLADEHGIDLREIGTVVAFFASDESSYLTGQSIHVDGGWVGK